LLPSSYDKALPVGARNAVRTVEISPQFAQSVVTTDPTQINVVALSRMTYYRSVYGAEALASQAGTGVFNLTGSQRHHDHTAKRRGESRRHFVVLPPDQSERFSARWCAMGLLTGETTPSIAARLMGRLERSGDRLIFGEVRNYNRATSRC
jgi:hypothetical protein